MNKTTLKEIASLAGVSISTVSRALNHDTRKPVSSVTEARILNIAAGLGYVPNPDALALRRSGSAEKIIGCYLASETGSFNEPFFSSMLEGIRVTAAKEGYSLGFAFTHASLTAGETVEEQLSHYAFEGILFMGRFSKEEYALLNRFREKSLYVGINGVDSSIDQVTCSAAEAAETAADYLIGLGHTRLGYIGVDETAVVVNRSRKTAFLQRAVLAGVPVREEDICITGLEMRDGMLAAQRLASEDRRPTAVFCYNDTLAMGAIKGFTESGLRVPDDISVISIDDIEIAAYFDPPLTTIHIPRRIMGRYAVIRLLEKLKRAPNDLPVKTCLPYFLIERGTCAQVLQCSD